MDKPQELIKARLEKGISDAAKTPLCLSDERLLAYFTRDLSEDARKEAESHISACGFCLSQLNLLFEAKGFASGADAHVPEYLMQRAKNLVKSGNGPKKRWIKRNIFLGGALIFFILSFFIPRYFFQFLAAAFILGLRWAFESEGAKTLIMVIDSWRRHSHDNDDEISRRLKDRFKPSQK